MASQMHVSLTRAPCRLGLHRLGLRRAVVPQSLQTPFSPPLSPALAKASMCSLRDVSSASPAAASAAFFIAAASASGCSVMDVRKSRCCCCCWGCCGCCVANVVVCRKWFGTDSAFDRGFTQPLAGRACCCAVSNPPAEGCMASKQP